MIERSIGQKLKSERLKQELTLDQISVETKIRKEVLKSIETDNFSSFDSHVYAKGFIKNYAKYLNLDEEQLLGIYRRDFEFKTSDRKTLTKDDAKTKQNPDVNNRLEITSKQLFFIIVLIIILAVSFLAIRLLLHAFRKPYLKITAPVEISAQFDGKIEYPEKSIKLFGETEKSIKIYINEEPVTLKPGNIFESQPIPLLSERNIIEIEARSTLGISSRIKIEIPKSENASQAEFNGIDSIITIKNDTTFLLVRADGVIKFNDQAFPNDAFNIKAERNIEIETSTPENVVVIIDNQEYNLSKQNELFEYNHGIVTQK